MKIADMPLCEVCAASERVTPAVEVHHIVPVEDGVNFEHMRELAYSYTNLMSCCHDCHVKQHILLSSKSRSANKKKNANITNNFLKTYKLKTD